MNVMGLEAVPTPVPPSEGNEDFETTENFLDGVTSVDEMAAAFRQYAEAHQTRNGSGAWEVTLPNRITVLVEQTAAAIESRNPEDLLDAAMDRKLQELMETEPSIDSVEGFESYLSSAETNEQLAEKVQAYAGSHMDGTTHVRLPSGLSLVLEELLTAIRSGDDGSVYDTSIALQMVRIANQQAS